MTGTPHSSGSDSTDQPPVARVFAGLRESVELVGPEAA